MLYAIQDRLNNGEGTSQRRDNGDEVPSWLYRVNKFFEIDHISDDAQKIRLDSMHMFGKALNWHKHFMAKFREVVTWDVYQTHVKKRFESVFEDPIVALKNLKQSTTIQVYQESFKELLNKVDLRNEYAISLFIGGLKEDITYVVRLFKPTSLSDVFCLSKLQEASNSVTKGKHTSWTASSKNNVTPSVNKEGGNKYVPGHKCSGYVFSLVVIRPNVDEDVDLLLLEEGMSGTFHSLVDEQPLISLNALTGLNSYRTMRVAKKLGCMLRKIWPLDVSVANGNMMSSTYECKGFTWVFQGITYSTDVMILPLGGCDMVLGIQWLATLGDIQWNFKTLVTKFTYHGKRVTLRGTQQTTINWMQGKLKKGGNTYKARLSAMSVCVYPATLLKLEIKDSIPKPIAVVLEAYEPVLEVPKELPPPRSHDQIIPLIPNTPPISVRPYRHPPTKKDAIELIVKELLDSGVIRNNQSPFSSPIVMVKKKDGTWRVCVDYKQLNKYIMKEKFPIPVIEELIDELSGSRTHEAHYEFLVMPFGLTNAPSTFQSLMNLVFKDFLRKFVLVFFDDILVYSKSLQDHVEHLNQVLAVLKKHSLFAKFSKCIFATNGVEYLGHIISDKGVSTNNNKIQAIQDWPVPQTLKQLRGFLRLTGYYRSFIKNYAILSQPLTALLRKNAF
ncbi:putative nucleotidyltransferase, ribonuclease H [Tanacetum coccineum]